MVKYVVPHPHDTLARHFLTAGDVAANLLRQYIDPEVARLLDLDNLKCESSETVDASLSEYIGDLRFSTTFKHCEIPSEVFIFLEHQSKKDRLIGFRLLRYIVNAYEKKLDARKEGERMGEFPYPLAVVLYHGKNRWKDMPRMQDLIPKVPGMEQDVLKFPLFLIDLAAMPSGTIKGVPPVRALLEALQAAGAGNLPERIDSITETLSAAKNDLRAGGWMSALLHYATAQFRFENAKAFYTRAFGRIFDKRKAEDMATTTAEEFYLEGLTEGEAKGKAEGEATAIVTVLEARFGRIPASVKKTVAECSDPAVLHSLTALAATCKSLHEFKRGLDK